MSKKSARKGGMRPAIKANAKVNKALKKNYARFAATLPSRATLQKQAKKAQLTKAYTSPSPVNSRPMTGWEIARQCARGDMDSALVIDPFEYIHQGEIRKAATVETANRTAYVNKLSAIEAFVPRGVKGLM